MAPKRRKAGDPEPAVKTVAVRAALPWVKWVEDGAEYCRTDVSKLIDAALADYLKARGFDKAPPKRTP